MSEKFEVGQRVLIVEGATWSASLDVHIAEKQAVPGVVVRNEPDGEDDIVVEVGEDFDWCGGSFDGGRQFYVNVGDVIADTNAETIPEVDGVWMAWNGATIAAFKTEIEALRYAIRNGGSAEKVAYGEELVL